MFDLYQNNLTMCSPCFGLVELFVDTIFCCDWHNINEDTKEFEATNLGPSCPLFPYNENEGKK